MGHFRDIIELHLGEEAEEFAEWAFGPNFKTVPQGDIWKFWNEFHGDALLLDGTGKPAEDIPNMIAIWKERFV
jgi:hypothetical protein